MGYHNEKRRAQRFGGFAGARRKQAVQKGLAILAILSLSLPWAIVKSVRQKRKPKHSTRRDVVMLLHDLSKRKTTFSSFSDTLG